MSQSCTYELEFFLLVCRSSANSDGEIEERTKRWLTWTYNSAIGMFLAFAVPVDIPDRDVLFSWNIEANYNLPTNLSIYDLTPPQRSFLHLNRSYVYQLIEKRLDNVGFNGRQCLLRLICDIAKTPLSHNGLFGQLLHILFTPSSSLNENLLDEAEAEEVGTKDSDCSIRYSKCPQSLIDMFSYLN